MKRILIFLILTFMLIGSAQAITIQTNDDLYRVVERTDSDTITITSDDAGATTHWILNDVDLGTNVLSQALTYNVEQSNILYIYQTNGALTSNTLTFTIIVTPTIDTSAFTKFNTTLETNLSAAIGNSSFIEIVTVSRDYYYDTFGILLYVIIWGIYAGMLYIRQNTWHIPAILGIILSVVIFVQLKDSSYIPLIQLGIIAGVFAVVYTFFKSRR